MKTPQTYIILAVALPMLATADVMQATQHPGQNATNYNGGENEYRVEIQGHDGPVNYAWSVDGTLAGAFIGSAFTNTWTLAQAGTHTVSCDISDAESNLLHTATWNVTVKRRLYVSTTSTASSPTGEDETTAFKNLYDAYMSSLGGDTIWVLPGSYVSFWLEDDRRITIESSGGARQTTIFPQYEEDPVCFYGYDTNITTIVGFTFSGGGAAYTTLRNCIVTGCKPNSYGYWGGPNHLDGARLENCLLTGNRVTCLIQSATLINCTVVDNEVVEAEEMYYYYGDTPFGIVGPYANIYNSILRFNYDAEGNEVNLANISADLYGSSAQPKFYSSCTYPRPAVSTNVITDDPCFADAVFGDYRLYKDSPCIDAGDNSFASAEKDLDGNDRIIGETVDMGCYEGGVSFPIPATPSNVTVGNGVAADGCIVRWDAVPGAREYVVYRSDNNTPTEAIAVATVAETVAEDVSSSTNLQYWYFVQARNESGASEMSAGACGWRVPSLKITSTTPNPVVAGNPISIAMSATGGQSPYTWHPCTNAYDYTKTEGSYSFAKGSTTGVGLTSSDSSMKEYSLPFDFPFGGKKYSALYISPYGAVLFGEKPNYFYPEEFKNYKLIAPLLGWSGDYGDVYIENSTTHEITFRWQYGYSGYESNFSLTLTETGVARMSYGTRNDYAYGAVVGISFGDNTNYIYEPSRGVVPTDHDVIFSPNVMPDGIALSSDGTITGKLTQVGDYSFLVSVKDALNNVRDELVTLTVVDNPNLHPVVTDLRPSHNTVIVRPDADNVFAVEASDPEGEPIAWTWLIDGATNCVITTPEFRYRPNEQFGGVHTLTCLISDGFWVDRVNKKWNIVVPKWYVSPSGSSSNSGNCFANAFASIQTAIDRAAAGDVIYVAEGVYSPVSTGNKTITVLAANNASVVIDGGGNSRCVNVGSGASYTNSVFNGITIQNGYVAGNGAGAQGGTFKNCILRGSRTYNGYYGGGVAYGTLYNCQINDNFAVLGAGGAYNATLYNCTVVGNSSRQNAGMSNCTKYNTICWGNTLDDGLTPNGNDTIDPELVADENGIYHLSHKSPHIDAGSAARTSTDLIGGARVQGNTVDFGAVEGAANGLYVKTVLNGVGKVSASVVVSEGGKCVLTATQLDEEHRFLGFYAEGVSPSNVTSSGLVHQAEFEPLNEETIVTAQFETRTFYVATNGDDANDARSWETARRTIRGALRSAKSGDTVLVADGVYEPFSITSNHPITIRSANGYRSTVIDGGFTNACAILGYDTSCRNTTLEGFTLQRGSATNGGGASYGTLRYCYITNNRASSYGGGVYNVNAENCILWKNTANNGGGAANSLLMSCTVYGNSCSNTGGGTYQGTQHNTIIVGNAPNNCYSGSQYSCYQSNNPMFVYQEDGDFRLREGSPCLNAGNIGNARGGTDVLGTPRIQDNKLDIGACEGAYPGFVIGTKTVGHGDVEPRYMLLAQGQDAYFTALEQERPFIGFSTNGVDILEPTTNHVWQNVSADGTLYVHFKTNIFVNAVMPDDSGDGLTPETAKRTLQAAATMAKTEEVIIVADGDYEPVNTANKSIRFVSENGWEKAIIDGGGTNRCVYVGDSAATTNTTFVGFTLRNATVNGQGGGALGGRFDNCVFENCTSTGEYSGGGASYALLNNCLVKGNTATYGGGTSYGTLVNCTVVGNTASRQGGGTYSGTIRNSIVWNNSCPNSYSNNYNGTFTYSCTRPSMSGTGNISANPYFADPAGGDYRLQQYSPCLDVGNNSYVVGAWDLNSTNRVIDARVDMGAYEGWVYLPIPAAVEGLSAEDGTRIGIVRLTWNAVDYARSYTIQRSVTETFEEYETLGTTGSCFYDDETATKELRYWYRVISSNPAGDGMASAVESGWCLGEMVFGANELPSATAGLTYSTKLSISGGSGNYIWKTGADDYDVIYGESTYLVSDHVSTGVSGDDNCLSYPLPFDFPFYGKSYNKVWVNSNGTINFGESYNGYAADEATLKTKAMIAVMWKDLRTGSGGVGVATDGNESITFFWNGASYYSGGAAVNASVTIYSDGTILCSYGNGNASGGFVGISAGDGVRYRNLGLNGSSLANYDDIRFVPQDVPGGLSLAADGTISGTAAAPGTYNFTVFVTDSYGNGATQKVTLEVEENPNMRTVQFDLGEYGVRGGGGALLQYVLLGESATAPTVRPMLGWVFNGWGGSFTEISDNVLVPATYRSAYADLHVDSIDFVNEIASGESLVVNWTVGNTGNPAFNGNMTEKISLVSTVDESVKKEIANPTFVGSILRDSSIARAATIRIPLKGCEGSWRVQIETAIRPSVREYDINNITVSEDTLEITATPLPDLSVKSIALDLDPAEYMPLDTVTVRYVVQNTGTGAAVAPWRDRLYLCKNGTRINLATLDETEDVAAGAEVERTIQCVIPELVALSGDVSFVVKADCDDSIVEQTDDDAAEDVAWETTPNATLGKRLYLTFASPSVSENNLGGVRFYAKRSGETDKALVLSLTAAGATSDVTFPTEITIGIGSSTATGYIKPIDNALVDGTRTVAFTLVPPEGAELESVASSLSIVDNEVPKLTMSFDKTSIKEGDGTILVTLTRELVTDEPLTVYLNGVSTSHCAYPTSVVIPAGEASVTFEIDPVNNDAAEIAAALTLRASANGYTSATQSFTVEDDDVPSVMLTIYPEEVSEGAGPNAAYAVLSRVNEDNIGSAITINLAASEPNQLIMRSSITIPAYTMAARFQFGPVDNGEDEGDRDITITGSIYIPSCGCSGQPSSGDVIEATIRIIDNDTPALSLTADPSTMKEGLEHAGDLILSHNSVLTEDLVVTLSYDTEGEIEIPASVVIPAGETTVTIPVKTLDDDETDGGKLVSVYADDESGEFKTASTWIQVSDQNLPDLKVSAISLPTTINAGKQFEIEFETANIGFVNAPNEIEYAIHLVGGSRGSSASSSNKIGSGKITGGIVVNDSIVTSYTITSPSDTGDYRVIVVIDPDGKISELDDGNNSFTSDAIAVSAAYTATVTVAEKVYLPGDEIVFTGSAVMPDGTTPAANLPVDLYVYVNGMRRTYNLTTDASGAFGMTFTPSIGEAGRYTIGACYPSVASSVAQDYFDILGMKRSSTSNIIWDYALGDTATRTVYIRNRSGTPLTGLTVEFSGVPEECSLEYTLPDTIPANGSVALTMTATAVGVTEQVDYSKFTAHLESAEGLTLDFPLYFHSQTQKAYLRANPTSINTTMAIGHTRYIDVTITNDGKGDSGKITLSVPDVRWLRIVSGTTIDNLASGESATVTLEVAPSEDDGLTLNNPLSGGKLAANCANGTGASVALKFTPVSDATGSIKVDAVDNITYTLASAPHLSNATVRVSNPYTGATVATGVTGLDGVYVADNIPEGIYQLTITAPNHNAYENGITIEPERITFVEPFLQYKLVSMTWSVEKVGVEDSYDIELLLDFETQVPAPIVKTHIPEELPVLNEGESFGFIITLENAGVIAAESVTLDIPDVPGYSFEFMENGVKVAAKTSYPIPVLMRRLTSTDIGSEGHEMGGGAIGSGDGGSGSGGSGDSGGSGSSGSGGTTDNEKPGADLCWHPVNTTVKYICGPESPRYTYKTKFKLGSCDIKSEEIQKIVVLNRWTENRPTPNPDPIRGNGDSQGGNGNFGSSPSSLREIVDCPQYGDGGNPCLQTTLECGSQLLTTCIPYVGAGVGSYYCSRDIASTITGQPRSSWWRTGVNCTLSGIGAFTGCKGGLVTTVISCAFNIVLDCAIYTNDQSSNRNRLMKISSQFDYSSSPSIRDAAATVYNYLNAQNGRLLEIFGDEIWLESSADELEAFLSRVDELLAIDDTLQVESLLGVLPKHILNSHLMTFVTRWNSSVLNWKENGNSSEKEGLISAIAFAEYSQQISEAHGHCIDLGFENPFEYFAEQYNILYEEYQNRKKSVCASVRLQLSQTLAMTREAFDGTLTMYNGNTTTAITNLKLEVSVLDEEGNECKDLFEIFANGTSGDMSDGSVLAGGLSVSVGGTGSAMIRFIPEREAAPTEEKLYRFGGTVTYTDPFSGETATVELTPVSLTVSPSPYLHLDYFVQRDVFADDPFTADIVEASMPAEMAVLVRNVGAGQARNVTIASAKPEIVQNEKGLAVDFDLKDYSLDATALNGATAHLGLNTVSLGTIEPDESMVAQWWLTSSIEGHFIGMSATVTPVNSWNTPDTMLVNPDVGVHKLVRSVVADADTLPDFLVCDGSDLYGTPNEIYTAKGEVASVYAANLATSTELFGAEIELQVSATPNRSGWNYGYLSKAGLFRYTITRVVRGDGEEISLRNAWITDRTFRDGNTPLLEERLHLVDDFETGDAQTYTVYMTAKPSDVPEVVEYSVQDGVIEYVIRNSIDVQFSKAIDASTFMLESIVLRKQGTPLADISGLAIAAADETGTRFTISGLAALCGDLGRYELVVQCAGIADSSGQLGTSGKSVAWTLSAPDSPYILDAEGRPTKRVRRMNGVTTVTSIPVTEESVRNLVVTLNGTDVSQYVIIRPTDETGTRFAIEGLDELQLADGDYTLVIDGGNLVGLDGGTGIESYTVTWTRDTVAPVLNGVRRETGLNGTSFVLELSEDADPETISLANVMLTRKASRALNAAKHGLLGAAPAGETEITLPATARLTALGNGGYTVTGIDSAILEDGTYTLYFDAAGVADEAGNEVSGVRSVTWTVDTTAPDAVSDIAVSSEYGSVDSVVYTSSRELTVSGTVPEVGLTVEIFSKYVGGSETLLAEPVVDGNLRFTADLTLPGDGNLTIIIRLTDEYGNSSDTEFSVYVDAIALGAEISGVPESDEAADTLTITFLNGTPDETSALAATMLLTKDGAAVAIPNVAITRTDDCIYTVSGLADYTAEYGTYVFSYDVREVAKATSGMTGDAVATATWVNYPIDTTPPTIADIRFNGSAPVAAYVTDQMFTEVSVRFSETVNVPELIENGLIGRAARIDLLDVAGTVTGCVTAVRRDGDIAPYQWDGESNSLSWQIDPLAVPAGRTRLMLDAGLIADLAGNHLAADGYAVTNGMRTYMQSETVLAQVNAQAMPMWYNGELYVGEKTADNKGKIHHYAANGTWSYLQSDGVDIEIPAQGCQGVSLAFADMDGDGVAETYVGTATGDVLKYPGGTVIASLGANRAMPYAYDINGDGCEELVAGSMDGRIRVISRDAATGTYSMTVLTDVNGAALTVPNGRAAPIVADINHDGLADIVSGDTAGNVWAYLGEGSAWYAAPITVFTNNVSLADRSRLGYGDVNGDGIVDLIVGRSDGSVMAMLGAETPSPIVPFAVKAVVSASAGAHGAIAPVGDATYDGGDAPEYTITPNVGYHVVDVQIDGVSIGVTNGYVFVPLTTSHAIHADFAVTPYAITYTGLKGATNPNPATYTVEDAVTFAAPGEIYGWVFKGWTPASIARGSTGAIEVTANWERQKFDVTVNGETKRYNYEDVATFTTDAVINCGATQYVCKGWSATNADPVFGEGARAVFRVLGDVALDWQWETNVVTLAQSVNADSLDWATGGAADWQPEWSDAANDGLHHAHSGAIGNNTNSWIETSVEGAGTLSFVWKSSTEARYDMFQFVVDGEVKGTISGETPWTTNTIVLAGGAHTFRWNYRKSRSGTAGADMVWLDSVTWTADVPPTLAEALNPDLFWMTDGDVEWTAVRKDTILDPHDDWATVGGLSDYESSLVGTEVYGAGVLTFDWAVSCEDGYDWFDFIADGEIRESITGEAGWKTVTIEFKTAGKHVLQWEYWKDDMDEAELVGANRARLDNVKWIPVSEESQYTSTTPDPVPFAEIRTAYSNYWLAAEGDYEIAARMIGRNGCAIWESYVAGLIPDDVDSKFTAKIDISPDGTPKVTWEPDTPELRTTRVYKTLGKKTLMDKEWVDVTDKDQSEYHFFKVTVGLP